MNNILDDNKWNPPESNFMEHKEGFRLNGETKNRRKNYQSQSGRNKNGMPIGTYLNEQNRLMRSRKVGQKLFWKRSKKQRK